MPGIAVVKTQAAKEHDLLVDTVSFTFVVPIRKCAQFFGRERGSSCYSGSKVVGSWKVERWWKIPCVSMLGVKKRGWITSTVTSHPLAVCPFCHFVYEIYETQDPSSSFGALHSKISLAKPATRSLSNRYSASSHNPIPNPGYFNRSWCDVHGRLLSPSCYQKWLNLRKSWGVEDFYMVSQTYVVGTARPTLYTVFLDAKLRKLGSFRIWNFKHRCKSYRKSYQKTVR